MPLEHIDITNLVVIAIAIPVAAGIPALFPRLPVPGVVLEIVIGALVGPQVLGWVHPGLSEDFLANFGMAMLFLMAGFEMDPAILKGAPIRNGMAGWVGSVVLAVIAVTILISAGLATGLPMTALALTATAVGVLMPILRDSGVLGTSYGPFVLAGGVVGEAGPVILLSLLLASGRAALQSLIMVAFAAAALMAGQIREGSFVGLVERTMRTSGQLPMRLTICVLILLVLLSQELDIDMVLGAFVAGAIIRAALIDQHREHIALRLDGVGSAFLIPIFFITAGVRLDVASLFSNPVTLAMVPVYTALMLLVRGAPVMVLYRSILPSPQRRALAFHLATQLSLVVPITAIAVKRGLMPGAQGAAMVGGAILTTLLFPALAARLTHAAERRALA